MANAVFALELGEELIGLRFGELGCWPAAVGGNEVEFLRVFFEYLRNVRAAAGLKGLEYSDLGGIARGGICAAKAFVDIAVEVDADIGADAVFEWFE